MSWRERIGGWSERVSGVPLAPDVRGGGTSLQRVFLDARHAAYLRCPLDYISMHLLEEPEIQVIYHPTGLWLGERP